MNGAWAAEVIAVAGERVKHTVVLQNHLHRDPATDGPKIHHIGRPLGGSHSFHNSFLKHGQSCIVSFVASASCCSTTPRQRVSQSHNWPWSSNSEIYRRAFSTRMNRLVLLQAFSLINREYESGSYAQNVGNRMLTVTEIVCSAPVKPKASPINNLHVSRKEITLWLRKSHLCWMNGPSC